MNGTNLFAVIDSTPEALASKRRRELQRIWEGRQPGWTALEEAFRDYGICTPDQFKQALLNGECG